MRSIIQPVFRFVVSDEDPTGFEYAVMLALIVAACMTAITAVGTSASAVFGSAANALSTAS